MANQEGIINEDILGARLQFRNLLEEYGFVLLAGSEADALSWLETQIIGLADSVARRERLRVLIQQTKNRLERGQDQSKLLPNGERKERPNPYIEVRFRRFRI